MSKPSLIEAFERAGQGHVFSFYNELAPDAQQTLLDEAAEIDLAEIDRLLVAAAPPPAARAACGRQRRMQARPRARAKVRRERGRLSRRA